MQIYSVVSKEMFEEIVNDDDDDGRRVVGIAHMAYGQWAKKM